MKQLTDKCIKFLGSTSLIYYNLLWLSYLTVVGTVAQRNLGLYRAQVKYFSSWFFWEGYIPMPGGATVLTLIFIGLVIKLLYFTKWKKKFAGIIIIHFGGALLLFGGFLTATFSSEGNMAIEEGGVSSEIADFHKIELAVIDHSGKDKDQVTAFSREWLKPGTVLKNSTIPFEIKIDDFCKNCRVLKRAEFMAKKNEPSNLKRFGPANKFNLLNVPSETEEERDRSGVQIQVSGAGEQDGIYLVFMYMDPEARLTVDGKQYTIRMRKERRPVPFTIELLDFEQQRHPGTGMARSFKSLVNLIDGDLIEKRVIEMNKPLRHRGYTLYQASFMEGQTQTSVLQVVDNVGRMFPYISSIIMCLGLLLHLMIQIPVLIKKREV